jgi:hypothetical protein
MVVAEPPQSRTKDQSGEPVSQPERNLNTVRVRHLHQPPPETSVRNRKPEEAPLVFPFFPPCILSVVGIVRFI